ncbi:MAG TPA: type 2 isopentenyl-diphosphate Delta-isomerase [Candidatus Brachybacterium merdigallinarum]|nr:type 2 isopentenyl-diphosphate Delta-isomerase [Candidatus Brachybacterium merdigallinarum]
MAEPTTPADPAIEPSAVRAARKDQHLALAGDQARAGARRNEFDDVELIHHALAGIDVASVSTATRIAGRTWPMPFYINGMTGGTDTTARVNRDLAIAARETGIAMGVGSMSVALDHPETAAGFTVIREENPDGFVMANLGAGRSARDALAAVELISADALQLHVNVVQETVMPEGGRDFSAWPEEIREIIETVPVPVVVKEVGFGLSRRTLTHLGTLGAAYADVSGTGGTDFVRIENDRRDGRDFAYLNGFGQSAVTSLLDAPDAAERPELLASGGVRTPLDVIRALALGARAVGVAGTFLRPVLDGGADALIPVITLWQEHVRQLQAMLGAATPADLPRTDLLLRGRVGEYCTLRGIDAAAFTRRSETLPTAAAGHAAETEPERTA